MDVLVVGAGPTGLTLAAELIRHGATVRIIDRAAAPATTSRALIVQARTLEVFEQMGMSMSEIGSPAVGAQLMFPGRPPVRISFEGGLEKMHTRHSAARSINQDVTEGVLREHLVALGATIEWGVGLVGFVQDADGVTAELIHTDGSTESCRTSYIAGCDGASSATRKAAGIPFDGVTYGIAGVQADVTLDWELPDGGLYFFPSGPGLIAAFPMTGERHFRLLANVPVDPASGDESPYGAGRVLPTTEDIQALVDERMTIPAKIVETFWTSRYRLHGRGVPRYRNGRAFLAGDAAHIHSPVGAQGMNTGIQDAHNLAWKLAAVAAGRAPDALLDTYESERHPVAVALLRTTDRVFGIGTSDKLLPTLIRRRLMPVIAPRVLRSNRRTRGVAALVSQLGIRYPNSPLNRSDGEAAKGTVRPGDRAPDGSVVTAGTSGRLHDLLRGAGHTVLIFAGTQDPAPVAELLALAAQLRVRYLDGPRVEVVAIGGAESTVDDPQGRMHEIWGAEAPTAFVVRPDGYVGYRGRPVSQALLVADLDTRLRVAAGADPQRR